MKARWRRGADPNNCAVLHACGRFLTALATIALRCESMRSLRKNARYRSFKSCHPRGS
jgi:hypothetical protein